MMIVSEVINLELLELINKYEKISYEDLRNAYIPPKRKGVILVRETSFDSNLQKLIQEGYISYDGKMYEIIR